MSIAGGVFGALLLGLIAESYRRIRVSSKAYKLAQELNRMHDSALCFAPWYGKYTLHKINDGQRRQRWKPFVLLVTAHEIAIYPRPSSHDNRITFPVEQLRWFGRPEKYTQDMNEIWLHFQRGDQWNLLAIRLYYNDMTKLVRALKQVTTEEIVTAYRRRRPYVHVGPVIAQPASEDIYGAWQLDPPIALYLMPLHLVLMKDATVARTIPLRGIQQIAALRRLDQPEAWGIVRFSVGEETLGFAVEQYNELAESLAEAAKRSLEAPLERKRKAEDKDDFVEPDDDDLWELQ
jgi:hypothetical protein